MRTLLAPVFIAIALAAGPMAAQEQPTDYDSARAAYLAGDYDGALAVIEPLARAGDPAARNVLADAYDEGNGVEQDSRRALELYQAAAAQGLAKAAYNLGVLLSQGRPGIQADVAQSIVHYEEAMEQNYAAAFNNRGVMHAEGIGGPVDKPKAVEMYRRAHELGDLNGTDNLADMLRRGDGTDRDVARALALWQGAAARGHAPSVGNLGAMYDNGIGVVADPAAAYALYRLAATGGVTQAGLNLFAIHSDADSPRHDPETALAWCLWSLSRLPEDAQVAAACAEAQQPMSPESVARARALADSLTR